MIKEEGKNIQFLSMGAYIRTVKSFIPKEAYKPAHYKLLFMFGHLFLICLYLYLISFHNYNIYIFSILSGISIAAVFTFCHELSHGTIVKQKKFRYLFELLFWSINWMPPTMWIIIHNNNHHINTNNYNDPDRRTFKSENKILNYLYNFFIYPNKWNKYLFTVNFAMILYTLKHITSVFYVDGYKPAIVTYKPYYGSREKTKIFFELIVILLIQVLFFIALRYSFFNYFIFTLISWTISSSILISLIVTQHLGNPNFKQSADQLLTSSSVYLPKIIDFIFDFHSFHTEHHVIPGMNFDYYPLMSKVLQEKYPDRYSRIPFIIAYMRSYKYSVLNDDPLI